MSQSESTNKTDVDEWRIYNDIKDIVKREVTRLKTKKICDCDDIAVLEKLTRIYANLKDDLREDLKSDLWSKVGVK